MTTKNAWLLLIISTVCLLNVEPLVAQSLTFDNNSYRANDSIVKKRVAPNWRKSPNLYQIVGKARSRISTMVRSL